MAADERSVDALVEAIFSEYQGSEPGVTSQHFIHVCQDLGIGTPRGALEPHVLLAVYSKARGMHAPHLAVTQARRALHEAAGIAGARLQDLLAPPAGSTGAGSTAAAAGRRQASPGGSQRLVPTGYGGVLNNAAGGAATAARQAQRSPVPVLNLAPRPSPRGDKKANELLQYMQGMGGSTSARALSPGRTGILRLGSAQGQSPRRLTTPRITDEGEERFERIVGRLEAVNAKKAEERQRLEEQLSSAELMHLVAEFGRRIAELEGRAANGDRALAQVEEHQGRLSQLEQLRAEEALLARVRQLESCVLAAQVKQEEERAAAQARQEADRAAAEAHEAKLMSMLTESLKKLAKEQAEKHAEMTASMQAAAAASSQALVVASETEQQLRILRPSFDDANNSWNASMDSALRTFEGTTNGQINELAGALAELTGQLQGLEASTKGQLSALDTLINGLAAGSGNAPAASKATAEQAGAASDDEPALSPTLVISSLQALGSSIEELGRQVSELQAAGRQADKASPSPSAPPSMIPLIGGPFGAEGDGLRGGLQEPSERQGLGANAALEDSLTLRLEALEAQGDKFQRFVVEVVKRTSELATASQEHERVIAGLSAGSSAGRAQGGGGTAEPAVAAAVQATARSSDRSAGSSDRSYRGGIVLGKPEPGGNGQGGGRQATADPIGSSAASSDQLSAFEFKITQTLTTMHQMHLRKILEWEEQLGAIQGQIQQLSGEQHQIQHQIQGQIQQLSEEQQQIWLHVSSGAPPSRQIVLVHTDKAEARMSPIVEE